MFLDQLWKVKSELLVAIPKWSVGSLIILLLCFSHTSFAKQNTDHDKIILSTALWEGVDPALVHAVIKAESNYNHLAVSHANAQGLMQLIPATAERFNVKDSFNPSQNVTGGTKYLRWLLKRFKGNMRLALAGYNAGEGAVDKYNGIPPYKETRNYVKKVMRFYRENKGLPPIQNTPIQLAKNKKVKKQFRHLAFVKKTKMKKAINPTPYARTNEVVNTRGSFHRVSSLTIATSRKPMPGYSRITAARSVDLNEY